jgi:carboxyl-terminal processing protease
VGDGPLVDIGLSVSTRNQYPTVITPHEASPSQLAGLLWGDQIRAINGRSLDNADLGECYLLMWGAVNSAVELTVYDPVSATTRPVVIQRTPPKAVPRPTVKFIAGGVAYRRLPEFTVAAVEALREDLIRLEKERSRGLILDIRNNPGGVFEAMQVAAKMFLPQGATIVTVEYPDPSQRAVFISDDTHKFIMPLAVLVNGGTSSEAEIFAAALHDNKRAQLVGSATFGKGRKIGQFPMPDGAMLYIPVARYVPPSGKDYHGTGLTPHLAVDIPRATERKMATDGFGAFDWLEHRQAILATDKPLARALDALLNQR